MLGERSPLHIFGPPFGPVVETRHRYFGGSLDLVSLDGWGVYRLFPGGIPSLSTGLTKPCRHRRVC